MAQQWQVDSRAVVETHLTGRAVRVEFTAGTVTPNGPDERDALAVLARRGRARPVATTAAAPKAAKKKSATTKEG